MERGFSYTYVYLRTSILKGNVLKASSVSEHRCYDGIKFALVRTGEKTNTEARRNLPHAGG